MVKMVLNLMALEEGLNNIHYYVDHLAGKLPEFHNDPSIINLMDRLQRMEITLRETLAQWPQQGLDWS